MAQTATTNTAREASLARRRAMSTTGKAAVTRTAEGATAESNRERSISAPTRSPVSTGSTARAASRERRRLMSTNGKTGIKSPDRIRDVAAKESKSAAEVLDPVGAAQSQT